MTLYCFPKGTVPGTWLSAPGEVPEDFPEYFTTEDMEAMQIEPDYGALWRVAKWKARHERSTV